MLALGALALAAVALALAWSEWRRERNVSFLCASAAFGVVTFGELVAIADKYVKSDEGSAKRTASRARESEVTADRPPRPESACNATRMMLFSGC